MQVLPSGTTQLSLLDTGRAGWVVESSRGVVRCWLVQPVPLTPYTWTFDFARAYAFQDNLQARESAAAVECFRWRSQLGPSSVHLLTDAYCAGAAKFMVQSKVLLSAPDANL